MGKDIIVIADTRMDDYGNLIVVDKAGEETRINKNHSGLHALFQGSHGRAVSLTWKDYDFKGKTGEYVDEAVLVDVGDEPETPSEATTATTEPPKGKTPISPQEKGMFWKEVGENFRAKLFDKDDGANGSLLWRAYMTQMFTSLEIKFEKKGE